MKARRCLAFLATLLSLSAATAASALGEPDPAWTPITLPGVCTGIARAHDASLFVGFDGSLGPLVHEVAKLDARGALVSAWGTSGMTGLATSITGAVAAVADGSALYFAEKAVRLDPSGHVDVAYGGSTTGDRIAMFYYQRVVMQDGSVYAAVLHIHADNLTTEPAIARLLPNGRVDTAFGASGYVKFSGDVHLPYAWSVLDDGSIEVAQLHADASRDLHPAVRHFSAGGDSVAVDGRLVPQAGVARWISPLVSVDASGTVLFSQDQAIAAGSVPLPRLSRFLGSGALDASFGSGGSADLLLPADPGTTGATSYASALWRTSSGDYEMVLGVADALPNGTGRGSPRIVRLGADGTVDPALPQGALSDVAGGAVRLPDGRIVYRTSSSAGCTVKRAISDTPAEGAMVEYYAAGLDHYFITLEGDESLLLDTTPAGQGWARTGKSFGAWTPGSALAGTRRLCRFYGDLRAGPNSHFYTIEGPECDGLRALDNSTPIGQAAWRFEGYAGNVVAPVDGQCAANLTPVFRFYNRGFEKGGVSNHRYTTEAAVVREMKDRGWAAEGVVFCVPPEPNNTAL